MIYSFRYVAQQLLGDRLKSSDATPGMGEMITVTSQHCELIPALLVLIDIFQNESLDRVVYWVRYEDFGNVHSFCSTDGGLDHTLSWGNILDVLEKMYNRASVRDLYSTVSNDGSRVEVINYKLEVLKRVEQIISQ